MGYRIEKLSIWSFLGLSTVSLNDIDAEVPQTDTGLSYGLAATVEYRRVQLGLFWGFDWLDGQPGEHWLYQNAYWLSFGLGYRFATGL